MIRSIWRLLRPYQWLKSSFVLVGLIFSRKYSDMDMLLAVLKAAFAFSLVSSAVYVLNDIFDREQDRQHPQKCTRPLAAGDISVGQGYFIYALVLGIALALGYTVSPILTGILIVYLLQNIAYSRWLKHVVILDVFLIALGFMLRILAGTWGVGIEPSSWLLLCGLMLALFMGFGKRWAELQDLEADAEKHRMVLESYSHVLLDKMIGIAASGVIITYSLYTMDESTVLLHGTDALIYTVPLVIYGVFRYLYLLHERGIGGDPARLVLKDTHIIIAVLLWLISVVWIISK